MILQSHTVDNPVTRPACGFLVVPFGTADGCWKLFDHRVRTYVLGLRIPDDTSAVKQHVGHRKLAKPRETMRYFFLLLPCFRCGGHSAQNAFRSTMRLII